MVNPYYDGRSAERIRAKTKRKKVKRGLWRLMAFLMIASLSIVLVHHFQWYHIRSIKIVNAGLLEPGIRDVMSSCLGRALWRSDAQRLCWEALQRFPALKECRAIVLPWGCLLVRVKMRRPVARVDDLGFKAVDDEGVCFQPTQGRVSQLPRLRLKGISQEGMMRAITAILASGGLDSSWSFEGSDAENIRLKLSGITVWLGNGRFEEKWSRLREILKNMGPFSDPCLIDLRFHNQAIVKRTV